MKAKLLANLLMMHPNAEVVFDDGNTEYIYKVGIKDGSDESISLTWDLDAGCFLRDDDTGELTEA